MKVPFASKQASARPQKAAGVPLRRVLAGYLVSTGVGCLVVVGVWWALLMLLMQCGFVLPAYTLKDIYLEAKPRLEECTRADFAQELSPYSRWALYSSAGGSLLDTNMDAWHLRQAQNAWQGGSGNLGYTQYHLYVTLADGAVCFLQYDYAVLYGDARLQRILPDFQACGLIALFLGCMGWIWANTRRTGRRIAADLALLVHAGERFRGAAQGDLEQAAPPGRATIREFGEVLQTMESMRAGLADSLKAQWRMDQQRAEQVAALAHDLKTPLTVIGGNAELLAEEELTPSQRSLAEAIQRGAARAGEYLGCLRELSAATLKDRQAGQNFTPIPLSELWRRCVALAGDLCAVKGLTLAAAEPPAGTLRGDGAALARALENLLENAVRYTPAGGEIRLELRQAGGLLGFAVTDQGPGFGPAALKNAGTLFYTEDAARPQGGHQGMGLYFAKAVAENHGGCLQAENLPHGGARVTLWVARQAEKNSPQSPQPRP